MVTQIAACLNTPDTIVGEAGEDARKLVNAVFGPTEGCREDPGFDVYAERLRFSKTPYAFDADASFINAKGFGGNNATGVVLSPRVTERLLTQRHGAEAISAWKERRERVREASAAYLQQADLGHYQPRYQFGEAVLEGPELKIHADRIHIPGYARPVSLHTDNPFGRLNDDPSDDKGDEET
jgi:acetoacetyl-[acyl-carrier protein] synthase